MTSASRGSPADGGKVPASVRGMALPGGAGLAAREASPRGLARDWWANPPDRLSRGDEGNRGGGFRAPPFLSVTTHPSFMGLVVKHDPVCLNCLLCPIGKLSLAYAVGTAPGQRVPGAGRSLPVHFASPPPFTIHPFTGERSRCRSFVTAASLPELSPSSQSSRPPAMCMPVGTNAIALPTARPAGARVVRRVARLVAPTGVRRAATVPAVRPVAPMAPTAAMAVRRVGRTAASSPTTPRRRRCGPTAAKAARAVLPVAARAGARAVLTAGARAVRRGAARAVPTAVARTAAIPRRPTPAAASTRPAIRSRATG